MAAPVYPSGVTVQGNIKLAFGTTPADVSIAKLAEINAAGSLDISCFVLGDGWQPDLEQNKGEAPRRICTKATRDVFGNLKYTLPDLMYSNNPQGASGTDGRKAAEKLVPGTTGVIWERLGLDAVETDWALGQFVRMWQVTLGEQIDIFDPSDEYNEFALKQAIIVAGNGKPSPRTAIVA